MDRELANLERMARTGDESARERLFHALIRSGNRTIGWPAIKSTTGMIHGWMMLGRLTWCGQELLGEGVRPGLDSVLPEKIECKKCLESRSGRYMKGESLTARYARRIPQALRNRFGWVIRGSDGGLWRYGRKTEKKEAAGDSAMEAGGTAADLFRLAI